MPKKMALMLAIKGVFYDQAEVPNGLNEVILELIGSHQISCYDETTISTQGVSFDFFVIEYGALNDCPSGCFSSVLCAIKDPNGAAIYSAVWTTVEEMPLELKDNSESQVIGGSGNSIQHCQEQPSGYLHLITSADEFNSLLDDKNSLFRYCR